MTQKTLTARQVREGKFLLRAPLVVIPLLTAIFWGLGGGRTQAAWNRTAAKGFNMGIPAAHVAPIVKWNKMDYYELAKRDSANERQRERMEHSYAKVLGLDSADAAVRAVREKLVNVRRMLAVGGAGLDGGAVPGRPVSGRAVSEFTSRVAEGRTYARTVAMQGPDLRGLEKMMRTLAHDDGGNTEIAGLTAMLEKLAALQTPHRDSVLNREPVKRTVLEVKALPDEDDTSRGFDSAAIEAIVPEDHAVVSGGEIRLELVKDILIGGRHVPAGTAIYGQVILSGERLRVVIGAIAWQDRVFPVNLQVADEDGLAGIYIPGAPMSDAVRESMGSSLGMAGPSVLNTGLASQAADAGVNLGRQLIGKKIRPVRVTIPAGYRVLLHPQNYGL